MLNATLTGIRLLGAVYEQLPATDRQIDHLVYDLYGLTADEIKIVEDSTERQ